MCASQGKSGVYAFGAVLHHLPPCKIEVSSSLVRAQLIELEEERGGEIDSDSPLRNKYFIDPDVLAYCRANSLFVSRQAEETLSEASERIENVKAQSKDGGGWGIWMIVIVPTVLILLLSFMGVSYGSQGLILPPFLGGELASPLLTVDNVDEITAGKTVFVKFMAPWLVYTQAFLHLLSLSLSISLVCVLLKVWSL